MPASPRPRLRVALPAFATCLAVGVVACTSAPGAGSPAPERSTSSSSTTTASPSPSAPVTSQAAVKKQRVNVRVLPAISQPGRTAAGAAAARAVLLVTVTPARKNRPAILERKKGKTFVKVGRVRVDKAGKAQFAVPVGRTKYRVTAKTFKGKPAVSSALVRARGLGAPSFLDDFNGTSLGSAWSGRVQAYDPDGMRNCSKGDPQAVALEGGALRLSVLADGARPEPCTAYRKDGSLIGDFRYRLNGHISTAGQASLRYGFAAARMKFPTAKGQHASFWLQPVPYKPDATSAAEGGAEIDVVEYFGHGGKNGGMTSFIYHPTPAGRAMAGGWVTDNERFLASKSDSWWTAYHVFSVEWTPTEYVFRIDGKETWRITEGISHQPQDPILSLLSSDYELQNLGSEASLPQHMYVDWIAFWQS